MMVGGQAKSKSWDMYRQSGEACAHIREVRDNRKVIRQ